MLRIRAILFGPGSRSGSFFFFKCRSATYVCYGKQMATQSLRGDIGRVTAPPLGLIYVLQFRKSGRSSHGEMYVLSGVRIRPVCLIRPNRVLSVCFSFQADEDRPLSPRPNQLRRLASYMFSSSTLETEEYPHSSLIQRSRSAESSPAHANQRLRSHGGMPRPHSAVLRTQRHSGLNFPRANIQYLIAKLMNKNS